MNIQDFVSFSVPKDMVLDGGVVIKAGDYELSHESLLFSDSEFPIESEDNTGINSSSIDPPEVISQHIPGVTANYVSFTVDAIDGVNRVRRDIVMAIDAFDRAEGVKSGEETEKDVYLTRGDDELWLTINEGLTYYDNETISLAEDPYDLQDGSGYSDGKSVIERGIKYLQVDSLNNKEDLIGIAVDELLDGLKSNESFRNIVFIDSDKNKFSFKDVSEKELNNLLGEFVNKHNINEDSVVTIKELLKSDSDMAHAYTFKSKDMLMIPSKQMNAIDEKQKELIKLTSKLEGIQVNTELKSKMFKEKSAESQLDIK